MITVLAGTVDGASTTAATETTPQSQPPTAGAAAVGSEEIVVVHERRTAAAVDIGGDDSRSRSAGTRDAMGRENWRLAQHGANGSASDGCRVTSAAAKGGSADSDWTSE